MWFALTKPFRRRGECGLLKEVWLTVGDVPMGWLAGLGVVQHIRRRLGGSVLPVASVVVVRLRRRLRAR
eukprot:4934169-Heterocapsa_arctica.AAC.1